MKPTPATGSGVAIAPGDGEGFGEGEGVSAGIQPTNRRLTSIVARQQRAGIDLRNALPIISGILLL